MKDILFKEDVEVEIFDSNSNISSYRLSYKGRHWRISPFMVYVYEAIGEAKNVDDAYKLLGDKYKIDVPVEKFEEAVCFFEDNGLIVGTADVESIKKTNKELWGKMTVIPAKALNKLKWLSILFNKKVMVVAITLEIICFTYIFLSYDSQTIISDLYKLDVGKICVCGLVIILFGILHEFGHSVALMSYGEEVGVIGMGVYLYMPVFYSNVTNAWKLKRLERVCVDFGGIYFQALSICFAFLLSNLIDESAFIRCAIIISALQIMGNFNPFIKMDGYWMICDFLGVSNPYNIVRDSIKNLFAGKKKKTEFHYMKLEIKWIFLAYIVLSIGYFTYLIRLMSIMFFDCLRQIAEDISNIGLLSVRHVSFGNIICFLQTRIISYLFLFFIIRLFIMISMKLLRFLGKKNEHNSGIRKN